MEYLDAFIFSLDNLLDTSRTVWRAGCNCSDN